MIEQQLEQDFKQALKNKDEITTSALRNLKAAIKNTEIERRKSLSEQEILSVVRKKVKQHQDSIASFQKGARQDLVEREQQQMAVLVKYLPPALSEDQVRTLVKSAISELDAQTKDFGTIMKQVIAKAEGAADGSVVSKIVKEELG